MSFEEKLLNFEVACKELASAYEEIENDSPEEIALINVGDSYPLELSFDELYAGMSYYVLKATQEIQYQKMLKLFNNKDVYVMAVNEFEHEENELYINKNWFYQAMLSDCDETPEIDIFEEQTAEHFKISIEEFKDNFLIVPQGLYELSIIASQNMKLYNDITDLAYKMGDKIL